MIRFVEEFGVNIVGGCCGTMPEHLKLLVEAVGVPNQSHGWPSVGVLRRRATYKSNRRYQVCTARRTSVRTTAISSSQSGRTPNGSRKFRDLLKADDWDGLVSMARDEMKSGSHNADVCVDFVGRDGVRDMHEVVSRFVKAIDAPLMLDSTKPRRHGSRFEARWRAMRAELDEPGGRGRARRAKSARSRRNTAPRSVAGTIDEDKLQAMARTAERKISIATRIEISP